MAGKNGRNKARPPKVKKLTPLQQYQAGRPSKGAGDGDWKLIRGVWKLIPKK